uniref:Uncharacterized protein n=1 Tax=Cyprinus carpio TaxID=7962 RepID=A0A8C1J0S8_CYPCA
MSMYMCGCEYSPPPKNPCLRGDFSVSAASKAQVGPTYKPLSHYKRKMALQDICGRAGPRVCYVCSDGLQLKGEIISVGSGSPNAYAVGMAREAVFRATHWDIYSGNNVDLFHIAAHGWRRRDRVDLKEEYTERGRERRRR